MTVTEPTALTPGVSPAQDPAPTRAFVSAGWWNWQLAAGGIVIAALVICSFVIPALSPYDTLSADPTVALQPPDSHHLFGTDAAGFDIFTRVFYAPRIDFQLALAGVGLGAIAGVLIGLFVGFSRGWFGDVMMRGTDVLQAFPVFILALALVELSGNGLTNVIWALAFLNAPTFLRLVRSRVLTIRELRYIEAAEALGNPRRRVILRHVLPNAIGPAIVQFGLSAGAAVLVVAGLAYLGVGIQAPTAEWGSMILAGTPNITTGQWWTVLFPGLALGIAVIGFNLLSEGVERVRERHRR
jgi:peptide/nickel transport system permease protein